MSEVPWWIPIVVAVIGFIGLVYQQRRTDRIARQVARNSLTGDQLDFIHEERNKTIEAFADIAAMYKEQVDESEKRLRAAQIECERQINLMLRELSDAKTQLQSALERIVEMENHHGAV